MRGEPDHPQFEAPLTPTGLPNTATCGAGGAHPARGCRFHRFQLNTIDLSTNAGWSAADELSDACDGTADSILDDGHVLAATGAEQFTDAAGTITLTEIPLGLYYVVETSPLPGSDAVEPSL